MRRRNGGQGKRKWLMSEPWWARQQNILSPITDTNGAHTKRRIIKRQITKRRMRRPRP
jgi:hypothetical protein